MKLVSEPAILGFEEGLEFNFEPEGLGFVENFV